MIEQVRKMPKITSAKPAIRRTFSQRDRLSALATSLCLLFLLFAIYRSLFIHVYNRLGLMFQMLTILLVSECYVAHLGEVILRGGDVVPI